MIPDWEQGRAWGFGPGANQESEGFPGYSYGLPWSEVRADVSKGYAQTCATV